MQIPNGFVPSTAQRQVQYDEEGRMREFRIGPFGGSRGGDGGIADANSLYATDAERFGTIAPFLKRNRIRDAQRRNYIIQAGGAAIYFETEPQLADAWDNGRVQFTAPSDQETFGHNAQSDGYSRGTGGRSFQVGGRGER